MRLGLGLRDRLWFHLRFSLGFCLWCRLWLGDGGGDNFGNRRLGLLFGNGFAGSKVNLSQEGGFLSRDCGLDFFYLASLVLLGFLLLTFLGDIIGLGFEFQVRTELLDKHLIDLVINAGVDVVLNLDATLAQELLQREFAHVQIFDYFTYLYWHILLYGCLCCYQLEKTFFVNYELRINNLEFRIK